MSTIEYQVQHTNQVDPQADGTCTYQGRLTDKSQSSQPPWIGTIPAALICNQKTDEATLEISGLSIPTTTMVMSCADQNKSQTYTLAGKEYQAEMKCTFAKIKDPWNIFASPGFIMAFLLFVALFIAAAFHHISVEKSTHLNLQR